MVAGKGHEKYQEIKGMKYHFDDKEVLVEMFELLENKAGKDKITKLEPITINAISPI